MQPGTLGEPEQNHDDMKITPLTILTFVFVGIAAIHLGCTAPAPDTLNSANALSNGDDDDSTKTKKTTTTPAAKSVTPPSAKPPSGDDDDDNGPPPSTKKRTPPPGSGAGSSSGASGGLQDGTGAQDQADPDTCFTQCLGNNTKAIAADECTQEQQCQDETCAQQCAQQANCSGQCLTLLDNCGQQCFGAGDDDDDTTATGPGGF